jgi:hypothetical protein
MKTKCLIVAFVVGMLASMPAYAWTWNNATYAARFRTAQPARATAAKPEVQVAVMGISSLQPKASNSGGDIWFGSSPRSHATHSH